MRVVVAHNYYKLAGGEDQCVAAEIALLRANGHEVIPYCLHNDAIDGMGRLQVAARTIWSRSAYREVRSLLRKYRPRIIHFNNTFPLISPAAYYAARAESVGVVQTLHNFRLLCPGALFFRDGRVCEDCLGRSLPWPGVRHRCYRGSYAASATVTAMLATHRALGTWRGTVDVYIALNEFSRHKFIEGGLPARKVVVKPNFIDSDPGSGSGAGGYALYVGRLSAEKGVDTLLKAWKEVGGIVPLKIAGDGPLAEMVRSAATEDPAIEWLGKQSLEAVYALLGAALFLVLPSRCYENFPRVVVEAYAKGTPVLASRLGAMTQVVEHGRTGLLFEPGDPADLAAGVRRLLADREELDRLRREARREYETKYTAEHNYQALLAIYERALPAKEDRS